MDIQQVNKIIETEKSTLLKKYRYLDIDDDVFNNIDFNVDLSDSIENITFNINKTLDDKFYKYIGDRFNKGEFIFLVSTTLDNKKSLDDISKLITLTDYNPSFDEYENLLDIDFINKKISSLVKKNISSIKEEDYSFINNNSFYSSLINSYCIKNNLLSEEKDLDEEIKDLTLNDSTKTYLKEIGQFKLLSRDEEREIGLLVKRGDSSAREKLINHNLRLVVSISKRFIGSDMTLLDIIQEGNIGLMKAVEKFDPELGYKFSTYASWWIRQSITRALADKGRAIRLPVHLNEKVNKFHRCYQLLAKELNRNPSLEEVADKLKISVRYAGELASYKLDNISLDQTVGDDDSELGEFVSDKNRGPEEIVLENKLKDEIKELLYSSNLTQKEIDVIKYRFGIDRNDRMTLGEVGQIFDVTRERIRQIEAKALKKLRRPTKTKSFANYLDDPDEAVKRLDKLRGAYYDKDIKDSDIIDIPIKKRKTSIQRNVHETLAEFESDNARKNNKKNWAYKNKERETSKMSEEVKKKRIKKDMSNLYNYFSDYSEEEVDFMIEQLNENHLRILHSRYGEDFKNPVFNKDMDAEDKKCLYSNVLPKMKRILDGKKSKNKTKNEDTIPVVSKEIDNNSNKEVIQEETITKEDVSFNESMIGNEDSIKILEMFDSEEFRELTKNKPIEESLVLSLKLGYLDGKYFTSESIGNFLGIETERVNEITRNGLVEYKEKLNQMIDHSIENIHSDKNYIKVYKKEN